MQYGIQQTRTPHGAHTPECMLAESDQTCLLTLSTRMLDFHFLDAALPATRSNSVADTVRPPSMTMHMPFTSKTPRLSLQTTPTVAGTSLEGVAGLASLPPSGCVEPGRGVLLGGGAGRQSTFSCARSSTSVSPSS